MNKKRPYIDPYLAGVLIGILILVSFFLTREGLGASGAFKRITAKTEALVAPEYIQKPDTYFNKYVKNGRKPLRNRLVFMVAGIFVGGFISGLINRRLKLKVQHNPRIKARTRLIAAVIGGILMGFGASFARGCTSGAGLNGMATLATAGFITIAVMFGTGYLFARVFRKLWL